MEEVPDPLPDPPPIPFEYLQRLGEAINGPAPISYQEQTEILTQLRSAYRDETDPDVHVDIRRLLDSLQQRPDTARTTVDEIASIHKTTPRPVTPLLRRSWGRQSASRHYDYLDRRRHNRRHRICGKAASYGPAHRQQAPAHRQTCIERRRLRHRRRRQERPRKDRHLHGTAMPTLATSTRITV